MSQRQNLGIAGHAAHLVHPQPPLPANRALTRARSLRVVAYITEHKARKYADMSVGVPKEVAEGERRVAVTPAVVATLRKQGFGQVLVERGAGAGAEFNDEEYAAAGATLVDHAGALGADMLLKVGHSQGDSRGGGGRPAGGLIKARNRQREAPPPPGSPHMCTRTRACAWAPLLQVRPPTTEEVGHMKPHANLISYVYPARNAELLEALSAKHATVVRAWPWRRGLRTCAVVGGGRERRSRPVGPAAGNLPRRSGTCTPIPGKQRARGGYAARGLLTPRRPACACARPFPSCRPRLALAGGHGLHPAHAVARPDL